MQHTKTPWRVGAPNKMGSVVADEPVPEIGGSDAVGYYGGHLIAESIAPRNAEFIVRACNAHDQLVAALHDARARLVSYASITNDHHPAIKTIDAALAAAGAA